MAYDTEIKARLGVDTSGIAQDMERANAAFARGAAGAGDKSGSEFGDKFNNRLTERFAGRGAFNAAFLAIGLDPKGIADTIAGAIVGGTKEGWEESLKISEKNAKLMEEIANRGKNKGQIEADLQKQIKEAQDAQAQVGKNHLTRIYKIAGITVSKDAGYTDEQQKKLEQAKNDELEAQNKLDELHKEDKKAQERLAKEQHERDLERLTIAQRIVALHKDENDLLAKLADLKNKGGSSADLVEGQQELLNIDKELAKLQEVTIIGVNDQLKLRKEETREMERQVKEQGKISDRSKLSLGELAHVSSFQHGVDPRIAEQARAAREAIRLEQKGEKARLLGDATGADQLFSQADKIKSGLSALTEKDKAAGELSKAFEPANQNLKDIKQILNGKFVNE